MAKPLQFDAKAAAKLAAELRPRIVAEITGKPAPKKTTRAPRKKKDSPKK